MAGGAADKRGDEALMDLALREARRGSFATYPNPWVGCVVAKAGRVLGRGFHHRAGGPHAEILALLQAGPAARGADLFVTLEPCRHWGRTPPCTRAILQAGIRRVVAACPDPNPRARGGLAWLKARGLSTRLGVRRAEAEDLNRHFLFSARQGRPWVTLKAAATLDGKAATASGRSKWITGEEARRDARLLRGRCDGVLVGAGTLLRDDPGLLPDGPSPFLPWRFILDPRGRARGVEKVFRDPWAGRTWLLAGRLPAAAARARITARGARIHHLRASSLDKLVPEMLKWMGTLPLRRLMVEGGPEVLGSFLRLGMAQELVLYLAPRLMGGQDALAAFGGPGPKGLAGLAELKGARVERVGADFKISGTF